MFAFIPVCYEFCKLIDWSCGLSSGKEIQVCAPRMWKLFYHIFRYDDYKLEGYISIELNHNNNGKCLSKSPGLIYELF